MSAARDRLAMTPEEFLAWDDQQEGRHEFDGVGPVAMVGNTEAHEIILANLLAALVNKLRGSPCRAVGSSLRLRAARSVRLPDAQVFCRPAVGGNTVVTDPVVVFEILSRRTAGTDRVAKVSEYWQIASLRHYVTLEQDQIGAAVMTRGAAHWELEPVLAAGTIALPAIAVSLAIDELYAGLEMAGAGGT